MRTLRMVFRLPSLPLLPTATIWVLMFFVVGVTGTRPIRAATPDDVENAIKRGKAFLYASVNKNGNWEESQAPDSENAPASVTGAQWGGLTSIATYALLASGDDPSREPKLQAAVDWLKKADKFTGTYAIGLRSQVWQFLDPKAPTNKDLKEMVRRDAQLIAGNFKSQGAAMGFCTYVKDGTTGNYDHSCSQYGVLGMWAAAQTDYIEIPQGFWNAVEQAWIRDQDKTTGGWSYVRGREAPKASMTAAGVASLFITQEYLHSMDGVECIGSITNPQVELGLKWMGDNFAQVQDNYSWYGVERIGVASGRKYFGTTDWFQAGANFLVRAQHPKTGMWVGGPGGPIANTAFALLFLVRGRAPVAMNKLEYTLSGLPVGKTANWNERPRDCANFAKWLYKECDSFWFNWQIVNLNVSVDDLHDSSILYVSGNQPLNFSKEHEQKLRQYLDGGGLIVFNGDCGMKARPFVESILGKNTPIGAVVTPGLASKLGYEYHWRKLPEDHVIYKNETYSRAKWREANNLEVWALSNGARELMILFSINDPSRYWQSQAMGGHEWAWQLMGNILFYSLDKETHRFKGHTYLVHPNAAIKVTKPPLKIARIQYKGNWNPEPGGWRQMAAIIHNTYYADIAVEPITLGDGKLIDKANGYKLAHITGTAAYHLDAAGKEELKKFIAGGGRLVADACGGSAEFGDAMKTDLKDVLGDDASQLAGNNWVKTDDPLFTAGGATPLTDFVYRQFAKRVLANTQLHVPRLRVVLHGKVPVCYFSAEDLSVGMVGQDVDGIYGYTPATSQAMMEKIIAQSLGITVPPPATKPGTRRPAPPVAPQAPATAPKKAAPATKPA